jgi:hypothetical protein
MSNLRVAGVTFRGGPWYVIFPECLKVLPLIARVRDETSETWRGPIVGLPVLDPYDRDGAERISRHIARLRVRRIIICDAKSAPLHDRVRSVVNGLTSEQWEMAAVFAERAEDIAASRWKGAPLAVGIDALCAFVHRD